MSNQFDLTALMAYDKSVRAQERLKQQIEEVKIELDNLATKILFQTVKEEIIKSTEQSKFQFQFAYDHFELFKILENVMDLSVLDTKQFNRVLDSVRGKLTSTLSKNGFEVGRVFIDEQYHLDSNRDRYSVKFEISWKVVRER